MRIRHSLIFLISAVLFSFGVVSHPSYASTEKVVLSQEESDFIEQHPQITLGVDPSFVPYEFIDTDGQYKGIAADYIQLICEKTGLQMDVEYGLSWQDAYNQAVHGQIDVLPCVSKTTEREKLFLYSEAYYTFKRVIFIRENENRIKNFEDLFHSTVAVQVNSSHQGFLSGYQSIRPNLYSDVGQALQAVSDGKETGFVGNLATSSYLIKSLGITNLKYIEIEPSSEEGLYFAVRSDWPQLVSILNKGIENITKEERLNIYNKWIKAGEQADYSGLIRILAIFLIGVAIVITVSIFWILRLKEEIEARRKTEEAYRMAKEEAESANQIKSNFLARMSHEIRTPLNAINGMVYLMEKTDVSVTQKLYLNRVSQASMNMLGIINDILDFSKIEAGKVALERISFDLDKVLHHVVSIVSYRIENSPVDFNLEKDPQLPIYYFGDPTRLEQILINLVNNAFKFTEQGSISLSVRLIGKKDATYYVQFVVKDTGIGMSENHMNQLFEPFHQGDASITRQYGGTGLGLSIVKNLVSLMGGTVEVESKPQTGTTFFIGIPLDVDVEREQNQNQQSVNQLFQRLRVLVVEKNIRTLNLILGYLESFQTNSDHAVSGEEAFKMVKERVQNGTPYDLIVVDYETPEEDGIEWIEKIKDIDSALVRTKTILMVPITKEDLFEKLEESKIDFGLSKPIIPSMLFNGIIEIFKADFMEHKMEAEGTTPQTKWGFIPTVLLIEDNHTNQMIAQSILEQSGYRVLLAENGKVGVDKYAQIQKETNLILIDLHMPIMDGYEATQMIRVMNKEVPIVAMTADAIDGVEEKCIKVGMNGFITKPFDPKAFLATVEKHITESQPEFSKVMNPSNGASRHAGMNLEMSELVLDREDGLRRVGGNEALYAMILSEFYKEHQEAEAELSRIIHEQDHQAGRALIHKIRGSAGNIGAKALLEIAFELQHSMELGNTEQIPILADKFLEAWHRLMECLKRELQ